MENKMGESSDDPRSWQSPRELGGYGPRPVRLSSSGNLAALVTLLVFGGSIFLYLWLSRRAAGEMATRALLEASGVETLGHVTRHWLGGDKSDTPTLTYEFDYNGRPYHGSSAAPRRQWEVLPLDAPITIRFVPGRPGVNHPSGWRMDVMHPWVPPVMAAAMSIPGFILLFAIRRQTRLLRDGAAVAARITGYRRVRHGVVVVYEFPLPNHTVGKGRSGPKRKPPEIGSCITVLYDREKPKRNAPYPLDMVEVER